MTRCEQEPPLCGAPGAPGVILRLVGKLLEIWEWPHWDVEALLELEPRNVKLVVQNLLRSVI